MNLYDVLLAKNLSGGGGSDLPAVTTDDNGKVMTVVEGAWDKADVPTELPAVTGADNGKFLGVANGAWSKVDAPSGGHLYWHTVSVVGSMLLYASIIILNTTPDAITIDDIKQIVNDGGKILLINAYYSSGQPLFIAKNTSNPNYECLIYYMTNDNRVVTFSEYWGTLTIQSFGTDSHQIM